MTTSHMVALSAGKVISVSPHKSHLDLCIRDRGAWRGATMDREQVMRLRGILDHWLMESALSEENSEYLADQAAFGAEVPMPVWLAQPDNCISIEPIPNGAGVTITTVSKHASLVSPGQHVAVVVEGVRRLGAVDWVAETDHQLPHGDPDQRITIRAWFPVVGRSRLMEALS